MSSNHDLVLVLTKVGPVKFSDLNTALNTKVADYDDVAYENLDHFLKSTTGGHIEQICTRWGLRIPEQQRPGSEIAKRNVWSQLVSMAIDEEAAKARRQRMDQPSERQQEAESQPEEPAAEDQPAPEEKAPEPAEKPKKPGRKKLDKPVKPGRQTGAKAKWGDNDRIYLEVSENPKRGNARQRFALYRDGMTVREYLDAGGKRADINWDERHYLIRVEKADDDS